MLNILKYKLLIFLKGNLDFKPVNVIKNAATGLVYAGFAVGIFFFTRNTISFLLDEVRIGSFLLHRFISIVLFIFFLAVNVGNIVVSYSTLYRSGETAFLFTKPVSFAKLFTIKFLDNFFYSSTTLLLIISAVIAGYGSYFKLSFIFYFVAVGLLLFPFMILAASIGVIVLIFLIKFAEKLGVRNIIILFIMLYIAGAAVFFKFSNPILMVSRVMEYYPDINRYFDFLDHPITKIFPNFWISDALYWISSGNLVNAGAQIIILNLFSYSFFLGAILLGKKYYFSTWTTVLNLNNSKEKSLRKAPGIFSLERNFFRSSQIEVMMKKEFWTFFRDPGQWLHLLIMFLLISVFISSLAGIDIDILTAANFELKAVIYLVIFLFDAFLISSLALRFVYPMISLEGMAMWKIKSSPVNLFKLLTLKFFIPMLLLLLVAVVLSYFSHMRFALELRGTAMINSAFITITVVSFCFGMGAFFVDYKEKNPIRIASSQGASITFLFILIYLFILTALLYVPLGRFFSTRYAHDVTPFYITSYILGAIAFISLIITLLMSRAAIKRDFN